MEKELLITFSTEERCRAWVQQKDIEMKGGASVGCLVTLVEKFARWMCARVHRSLRHCFVLNLMQRNTDSHLTDEPTLIVGKRGKQANACVVRGLWRVVVSCEWSANHFWALWCGLGHDSCPEGCAQATKKASLKGPGVTRMLPAESRMCEVPPAAKVFYLKNKVGQRSSVSAQDVSRLPPPPSKTKKRGVCVSTGFFLSF